MSRKVVRPLVILLQRQHLGADDYDMGWVFLCAAPHPPPCIAPHRRRQSLHNKPEGNCRSGQIYRVFGAPTFQGQSWQRLCPRWLMLTQYLWHTGHSGTLGTQGHRDTGTQKPDNQSGTRRHRDTQAQSHLGFSILAVRHVASRWLESLWFGGIHAHREKMTWGRLNGPNRPVQINLFRTPCSMKGDVGPILIHVFDTSPIILH